MKINEIKGSYQQNFGTLHLNDTANVIKKRINKDPKKVKILNDLIKRASSNKKVNIELTTTPNGENISAELYTTSKTIKYFETKSENFFSKYFQGGILGFIKRCVERAELKRDKIIGAEHVTNHDYVRNIAKNLQ